MNLLFVSGAGRRDAGTPAAQRIRNIAECPTDTARAKYFAFMNLGPEHDFYKNVQLPGDTLSRDFVPDGLAEIPTTELLRPNKTIRVCADVLPALTKMAAAMHDEIGRPMAIASGYRSFGVQKVLYGGGEHGSWRAFPGLSQHQTGYALDLIGKDNGVIGRSEIKWLKARAWEFGFVQSYTAESAAATGIVPEAWHYLYVGKETAKFIQQFCADNQYEFLAYLKEIRQK